MNIEERNELKRMLQELKELKICYVNNATEARWRQAEWSRHAFRIGSIFIIACSITIPFVAALSEETFPLKPVVLAILGLLIAGATGVTSFFNWGEEWHLQREAHRALVHLTSIWELELIKASYMGDCDKAQKTAYQATQVLLDATGTRLESLWAEYFKNLKLPDKPSTPT